MSLAYGYTQNEPLRVYGKYYKGFTTPTVVRLFTNWGLLISIGFLTIQGAKVTFRQMRPMPVAAENIKVVDRIVEIDNKDRTTKLQSFLKSKGSPMADYAQLIIDEADKNGLDWTLITSISGMESAYGKRIPAGSHNAWGIGGTKFRHFASWDESIKYVSKLMGDKYRHNIARGIQTNYCPPSECNKDWPTNVVKFSKEILAVPTK